MRNWDSYWHEWAMFLAVILVIIVGFGAILMFFYWIHTLFPNFGVR